MKDNQVDDDFQEIIDLFFLEAAEHTERMEAALLKLEESPEDPDLVATIFRSAHSIKGTAGAVGFEAIAHFTHSLESLLDLMRDGKLIANRQMVDLLLRSLDVVKQLIVAARSGRDETCPEALTLTEELKQAMTRQGDAIPRVAEPVSESAAALRVVSTYSVQLKPAPNAFRLGLDPTLVIRDLARMGDIADLETDTQELPHLEDMDPEISYLAWKLKLSTSLTLEELREELIFVADMIEIEPASTKPIAAAEKGANEPAKAVTAAPSKTGKTSPESSSIRVPTAKVDKLVDLVGELVIAQSMAAQLLNNFTETNVGELKEAIDSLAGYTRDLQEQIMRVRMLPIASIFNRFPRLVRDVASGLGKDVNLVIQGEETELDKGVVEQLSDPLTHLIRNSIDHGLELPEERKAAGKQEQGTIGLSAWHQAGSVIIEVGDDGRGLNTARIRQKAIERGLIGPGDERTDEQINTLIFHAGFSTADKVSDLSGRGVGMDVVKRNIEALKGTVTVQNKPGKGCTIRIKLPLTLAILDGLSMRVGEERFILPLGSIVESIRPRAEQLKKIGDRAEVLIVRKETLRLVRLHHVFAIPGAIQDPSEGLAVIVEHDNERFALLVDELLGQQQVVVKSLEANFKEVEGVMGATILGDGRVALVVDIAGLSETNRSGGESMAA